MDEHVRKLAAVVAADVVGFSRLMGEDEGGTLSALKAHRNAVDPVIFSNGGRIVKTTGDGMLLEFPTVVSAVRACLKTQQIMAERNATLPAGRRMQFRIGVHLGEILVDGEDIFGDVVNIAARLEEAADPGGIALSGAARDSVYRHIDAVLVDLGNREFKNIAEPIALWRIDMGDTEQAGLEAAAASGKAERSALAILPFDNMSNDPEQEYFVDGITEDLITALSLIPDMKVIARNSTFSYKGKAAEVKQIAAELDARYVLEGSVRKASNRIRITAQLIDATSGQHMWAERYDRDLTDIFDLQDEITANIASRVAPTLRRREVERAQKRSTNDLNTWEMFLRVLHHYYRLNEEDFHIALKLCEQIQKQDPNFAPAFYQWTFIYIFGAQQRFLRSTRDSWRQAVENGERGVALAGDDFQAHVMLSNAYAFTGQHDGGLQHGRAARNLNSYAPSAWAAIGIAHWINGDHAAGAEELEMAWRLSANDPERFHYAAIVCFAHYQMQQYDAALSWTNECLKVMPTHTQAIACQAASLAQLGRQAEAATVLKKFNAVFPEITASRHLRNFPWRLQEDLDHYADGLIKAGLPP